MEWNLAEYGDMSASKKTLPVNDLFWAEAFYYFYISSDGSFIFIVTACIQYF